MVRLLAPVSLLVFTAAAFCAELPLKATPLGHASAAARWAEQLGDRDFQTRDRASRELDALGEAALPALEKVIASGSPEAVRRAVSLTARVLARAENARAIAPKLVTFELTDQPLSSAFGELEKQTGYRIRVNGDQSILAKKGNFAAKKEPFWVVLDRLAAGLSLEFDSASSLNMPVNMPRDVMMEEETRRKMVERDVLQTQIAKLKVVLATMRNQEFAWIKDIAKLKGDLANEKNQEEQAKLQAKLKLLSEQQAALKTQAEATLKEIAAIELRFSGLNTAPPPAGTVVLRPAGSGKPPAVFVSGAVRIQAAAFPGQLAQVSREVLPLMLTATPEPSMRWVRTTETIITKATTPDGRVIVYDPSSTGPSLDAQAEEQLMLQQLGARRRGIRLRGEFLVQQPQRLDVLGGYMATPTQSLVRLQVPTGAAVTKLASVEGLLRAKVWTQPEAVATLKSLSGETSRIDALGGVYLAARVQPDPNDKTAYYLDVELAYDATEVSPQIGPVMSDPLYLENGPNGRAVPRRPTPRAGSRGNPQGLVLSDGHGVDYTLSLRLSETAATSVDPFTGMSRVIRLKQQYIVRPSKPEAGPPTKLAFSAVRMREVDLPFKLTDVPVAAGSQDPNAVQSQTSPVLIER